MVEAGSRNHTDAVRRLSEGQLACLRLVMDGHTSKQIAKTLGISPHTVDQRLRMSIQLLGVDSRFEAARIVRRAQVGYQDPVYQPPQSSTYQAPDVVPAVKPDLPIRSSGDMDGRRGDAPSVVGEARPVFEPLPADFKGPSLPKTTLEGERRNALAPVTRIAWTIGLTIGVVLAISLLITAAEGLVRLLEGARP